MSSVTVWSDRLNDARLGLVRVWVSQTGVRRIEFGSDRDRARPGELPSGGSPPVHLGDTLTALQEYLDGRRRRFDLPLDLSAATAFQQLVYGHLMEIPYGQVTTYGELAWAVGGLSGTARAVGQAVGANPVAIVVPCHRVVAAGGKLGGYGGGLERKAALLRLEGVQVDGTSPSSRVHPDIIELPL